MLQFDIVGVAHFVMIVLTACMLTIHQISRQAGADTLLTDAQHVNFTVTFCLK